MARKANEMYMVEIGEYDGLYVAAVTDEWAQAVVIRDEQNEKVANGTAPSDMTAEITTVRAYRKGQKVR